MARRACLWVPGKLPAWASLFFTERSETNVVPIEPKPVEITKTPRKLETSISLQKPPRKKKSGRLHKVRHTEAPRRVVMVVTDIITPDNKPSEVERQRFLKRLGVA
ncbi:MAG: hypothetical protein Q7S16_04290 [bacterium]|nr:hypothetical protein [bacterium]